MTRPSVQKRIREKMTTEIAAKYAGARVTQVVNRQEILAGIEGLYAGVKATAKAYGMEYKKGKRGRRAEPRMCNFLEEYFGSLKEIRKGML